MHVERDVGYVGLADVDGGLTNVAMVVPATFARARERGPRAVLSRAGCARARSSRRALRGARLASPVRVTGRSRRTRGARGRRARRSSATPPTSSTRSPARGSTPRCAAASCSPRIALASLGAADGARRRRARWRATIARGAREFAGKWIVERLIGAAVGCAPAMNYFARTLAARKDMADLLVGVTGDFVPAREVLRPGVPAESLSLLGRLSRTRRMTIDPDSFRSVLGRFASGITVVTTRDAERSRRRDDGERVLLGEPRSAARAGLRRPRGVAVRARSSGARTFGVSILAAEQEALSRRFADRRVHAPVRRRRLPARRERRGPARRRARAPRVPHRRVARGGRPHDLRRRGGERDRAQRASPALLSRRLRAARAVDAACCVPARRRGFEILDDPATDPALRERSLRDVRRSNLLLGGAGAVLAELARLLPRSARARRCSTSAPGSPTSRARACERAGARGVDADDVRRRRGGDALARESRALLDGSVCARRASPSVRRRERRRRDLLAGAPPLRRRRDSAPCCASSTAWRAQRVIVSDLRRSWLAACGFWLVRGRWAFTA